MRIKLKRITKTTKKNCNTTRKIIVSYIITGYINVFRYLTRVIGYKQETLNLPDDCKYKIILHDSEDPCEIVITFMFIIIIFISIDE